MKNSPMFRHPFSLFPFIVIMLSLSLVGQATGDDPYTEPRAKMIEAIVAHARFSGEALEDGTLDPRVLQVMRMVPRHAFLPKAGEVEMPWWQRLTGDDLGRAYSDRPLPIGYGQTISQPFIVAMMTHLLRTETEHTVLEIGTGSGYQAAVLSPLVKRVCTIEIIPELAERAAVRHSEIGYGNIEARTADGYHGWPECGPFDSIVVTAAASHIPSPLVQQLKPGGRMVIPVGPQFTVQHLTIVDMGTDGRVTTRQVLPVSFVPLVRAD